MENETIDNVTNDIKGDIIETNNILPMSQELNDLLYLSHKAS